MPFHQSPFRGNQNPGRMMVPSVLSGRAHAALSINKKLHFRCAGYKVPRAAWRTQPFRWPFQVCPWTRRTRQRQVWPRSIESERITGGPSPIKIAAQPRPIPYCGVKFHTARRSRQFVPLKDLGRLRLPIPEIAPHFPTRRTPGSARWRAWRARGAFGGP